MQLVIETTLRDAVSSASGSLGLLLLQDSQAALYSLPIFKLYIYLTLTIAFVNEF
jgi:hypothetical protein